MRRKVATNFLSYGRVIRLQMFEGPENSSTELGLVREGLFSSLIAVESTQSLGDLKFLVPKF